MTSFGATGKIITDIGGQDFGFDVVVQNDGKILVTGTSDRNFTMVRYNLDGSLDESFGTGGKLTTTNFGGDNPLVSVAFQSDGKILVARTTNNNFAIARFNLEGTLDTSFGANGIVITDFGGTDSVEGIAVQSDGQILVTGASNGNFAIARYNPDGTLDNTFSADGRVTTDFGGTSDSGLGIAVQNDGKILVSGTGNTDLAVARYNPDGTPDTSFSMDGRVTTDFGGFDIGRRVFVQDDGKILATGSGGSNLDFMLARYNADGTLDQSFGSFGRRLTNFGDSDDFGIDAVFQSDGKFIIAGRRGGEFALARYNSDGTPDTTFDGDGRTTTDFGGREGGFGITLQSDGKILVVGRSDENFAIARYNPDGSLDANILPTSADASVTAALNAPYTFAASDFPFNDANGETLRSIYIVGLETAGSLFFDSDGNGQEDDGEAVRMDQIIAVDDLSKLKFTPDANVDRASFQFKVRDAYGFSTATYTMSIDLNDPPSISGTPATTVDEDGTYSFTPIAIDPEGTPLTFSIQNQPTWASFDSTTGTLSGTPTNAAVGTTSGIVISVSDGVNSIALPAFDLTVNNTNDAPIVASAIANQTAQAGRAFSFTLPSQTFRDVDPQDRLRLSATQANGTALPSWLRFDAATGRFTGTPPQAGSIALRVTATDTASASISDDFVLAIAPFNPLTGQPGRLPSVTYGSITNRRSGTSQADRRIGTAGNDSFSGAGGNDTLEGQAGDDLLGGDTGDDILVGGSGNDRLSGGLGNDALTGDAGRDRLVGGTGRDTLRGGADSDVFVFDQVVAEGDRILDFEQGDRIDLRGIFASDRFRGAALDQVVRARQSGTTTQIQVDADGLGSGRTFTTIATLEEIAPNSLSASNFVIR